MRLADADILIIPGLGNAGPDHWQSRWQAKIATARRVEQADWDDPDPADWGARIAAAVNAATRPVVLVAHSCGAVAALQAAAHYLPGRMRGAFLVAPADVEAAPPASELRRFAPLTAARLDFPAVLIASSNDPFASFARSEALAQALGADFVDAGGSGHINADSGHGPWPEGLLRFAGFLRKL